MRYRPCHGFSDAWVEGPFALCPLRKKMPTSSYCPSLSSGPSGVPHCAAPVHHRCQVLQRRRHPVVFKWERGSASANGFQDFLLLCHAQVHPPLVSGEIAGFSQSQAVWKASLKSLDKALSGYRVPHAYAPSIMGRWSVQGSHAAGHVFRVYLGRLGPQSA